MWLMDVEKAIKEINKTYASYCFCHIYPIDNFIVFKTTCETTFVWDIFTEKLKKY